jgi:hypothetical protein
VTDWPVEVEISTSAAVAPSALARSSEKAARSFNAAAEGVEAFETGAGRVVAITGS